jgi:hypothetical protein
MSFALDEHLASGLQPGNRLVITVRQLGPAIASEQRRRMSLTLNRCGVHASMAHLGWVLGVPLARNLVFVKNAGMVALAVGKPHGVGFGLGLRTSGGPVG